MLRAKSPRMMGAKRGSSDSDGLAQSAQVDEAQAQTVHDERETYEGVIWKKTSSGIGAGRWLDRYYVWDSQSRQLTYWKDGPAKENGQAPKGAFHARDFHACKLLPAEPAGSLQGRFRLSMTGRILELKCNTKTEAKEWVKLLSKHTAEYRKRRAAKATKEAVVGRLPATDDSATESWSDEEIMHMMQTGQVMSAYFMNNTMKHLSLFCVDGVLYASAAGEDVNSAVLSIPLGTLTDVFIGKQTQGFETPLGQEADYTRCFSLRSHEYVLDVETRSMQMAAHWIKGVELQINATGKAILYEDADEEEGAAAAAGGDEQTSSKEEVGRKRANSVMGWAQPAKPSPPASDKKAPHDYFAPFGEPPKLDGAAGSVLQGEQNKENTSLAEQVQKLQEELWKVQQEKQEMEHLFKTLKNQQRKKTERLSIFTALALERNEDGSTDEQGGEEAASSSRAMPSAVAAALLSSRNISSAAQLPRDRAHSPSPFDSPPPAAQDNASAAAPPRASNPFDELVEDEAADTQQQPQPATPPPARSAAQPLAAFFGFERAAPLTAHAQALPGVPPLAAIIGKYGLLGRKLLPPLLASFPSRDSKVQAIRVLNRAMKECWVRAERGFESMLADALATTPKSAAAAGGSPEGHLSADSKVVNHITCLFRALIQRLPPEQSFPFGKASQAVWQESWLGPQLATGATAGGVGDLAQKGPEYLAGWIQVCWWLLVTREVCARPIWEDANNLTGGFYSVITDAQQNEPLIMFPPLVRIVPGNVPQTGTVLQKGQIRKKPETKQSS